jgi:hypothetical protein
MRLSSITNYVPKFRISSPEQVAKNLQKITLPAIAFFVVSMIKGAQAISYVECIDNCDKNRDTPHLAKLICYTLCAIFAKK